MARVRTADGGDHRGMARGGEPVMDSGPDATTSDRCFARPVVPGNQQQHTIAGRNRPLERLIDGRPGRSERHSVQIERAIRSNRSGLQPSIPGPVESRGLKGFGLPLGADNRRWPCGNRLPLLCCDRFRRIFDLRAVNRFARQRPDRRRYSRPKRRFVRAERAHARRHPWAGARTPAPSPPYPPQASRRRPRCPRRYRSGWSP